METGGLMDQNSEIYNWVIFPLLIFFARLCDVSLGTLRGVLASKGKRQIVPFIGFFEVLIWLVAISQIMSNLTNVMCYLAWAGGYATGSYLGLLIEEKLALGLQVVRIITNQEYEALTHALTDSHLGYTIFDGQGARGPIKMIFTIVKRKEVPKVAALIREHNAGAFFSVEDVKSASAVSYKQSPSRFSIFNSILPVRKGK